MRHLFFSVLVFEWRRSDKSPILIGRELELSLEFFLAFAISTSMFVSGVASRLWLALIILND